MPEKIRLLWFNHRDIKHSRAGGAERSIIEIASRLAKYGFSVTLCSVSDGTTNKEETYREVSIMRYGSNMAEHYNVRKTIKAANPDIIIEDMAHAIPWVSRIYTDKPVVVYFRHMHSRTISGQLPLPQALFVKSIEKRYKSIFPKSTFITESEPSAKDLRSLGIKKERIHIIPPGVDHGIFRKSKKTKYPSMVYFSGMRDYKRPLMAIEAFKKAITVDPNTSLHIIGSGPSSKEVSFAVKMLGSKNIFMHGRVTTNKLSSIVSKSWLNLNFSVAEGFGYSILESAASGTPTIALDAYGVSDIINKYKLGITIKDMDEFGPAFRKIISNISKWGNAVHKSAMRFTWEECAKEWAFLLKNEISKHGD